MPNIRVMPPNGIADTKSVNGRRYTCASNATIDVPDFDAHILTASGWINAAGISGAVATFVGNTSERPDKPAKSQVFLDTTLGLTIVWDGSNWRNPATGASV